MRGESRHWTLRKSIVGKRLPWEEPWPWGEPWPWEAKWIWDKGHSQPKPEKNWKNTYLHLTLLHPPPPNLLPRFLTGQTQSETRGKKDFWQSHYRTASGSRVGWEGVKSGSGGTNGRCQHHTPSLALRYLIVSFIHLKNPCPPATVHMESLQLRHNRMKSICHAAIWLQRLASTSISQIR